MLLSLFLWGGCLLFWKQCPSYNAYTIEIIFSVDKTLAMDPSPAPSESGRGEQQYIFNEREFEGDDFHAASFVAKYRRVTSLESLRDQLRGYGSGLKDQLYDTINRDYKDFIDIATKVRWSHLHSYFTVCLNKTSSMKLFISHDC